MLSSFLPSSPPASPPSFLHSFIHRHLVISGIRSLMLSSVVCFSAWLKDTVDPMLVTLDHRIAALTGLDVQPPYAEYLQVVNYGIGGHYEPHFDHATVTMGSVTNLLGREPGYCLFPWSRALIGLSGNKWNLRTEVLVPGRSESLGFKLIAADSFSYATILLSKIR